MEKMACGGESFQCCSCRVMVDQVIEENLKTLVLADSLQRLVWRTSRKVACWVLGQAS